VGFEVELQVRIGNQGPSDKVTIAEPKVILHLRIEQFRVMKLESEDCFFHVLTCIGCWLWHPDGFDDDAPCVYHLSHCFTPTLMYLAT